MTVTRFLTESAFVALGAVFMFVWVAGFMQVWRKTRYQPGSRSDRIFWLSIAVILPVFGPFLFWIVPGIVRSLLPNWPISAMPSIWQKRTRPRIPLAQPAMAAREPFAPHLGGNSATLAAVSPARPAFVSPAPPGFGIGCRVTILEGPGAGSQFHLAKLPAVIGRGSTAHIRLDADRAVSREHAEIFTRDGHLGIRDLQSTHGTQVNNLEVIEHYLAQGDVVRVGSSVMTIEPQ